MSSFLLSEKWVMIINRLSYHKWKFCESYCVSVLGDSSSKMFPMKDLSPTVSMNPNPAGSSRGSLPLSPSASSFSSIWDGLRGGRNSVVAEEKVEQKSPLNF